MSTNIRRYASDIYVGERIPAYDNRKNAPLRSEVADPRHDYERETFNYFEELHRHAVDVRDAIVLLGISHGLFINDDGDIVVPPEYNVDPDPFEQLFDAMRPLNGAALLRYIHEKGAAQHPMVQEILSVVERT
jgi:hypothetical protein